MKKAFALLLALTLCATMTSALAANLAPASDEVSSSSKSPRWEETEWKYRAFNGVPQKRLWSITRGIWLTEWENC